MANPLKILVLLFVFLSFLSCSKYYRFDELYDKSEYTRAYSILDQIQNKGNLNYERRYYRVIIRLALEGNSDFIEKLRSISRSSVSKELVSYYDFGQTYLDFLDSKNSVQYTSVLSNLTEIKLVPDEFSSYGYKIRGISYYKTGHYPEAISDLQQSFRMIPSIDNLFFIGMCYYNKEDHKQAAVFYNRVIDGTQNPFYRSLAYFQLGEIDYYLNKYESALDKYVMAINSYSDSADYSYKIAKCLQKLKYAAASPKFLKIALRIQKDYANAWYFLNYN